MPLSLECPRCSGAVSVADQAAGQRVKCPHCDQTFLAPGIAPTSNDDDDWLSLEEAPQPAAPEPTVPVPEPIELAPEPIELDHPEVLEEPIESIEPISLDDSDGEFTIPTPAPAKKPKSSSFSADEEALLAEFTTDLDEFTAEIESPPPPHPSSPAAGAVKRPGSSAGAAALGGAAAGAAPNSPAGKSTAPKRKPASDVVEYAKEYRVKCHICGSFIYAKAEQAGKTLKCSDCYSPITVPPPPKIKKKQSVDLDKAATFGFEPSKAPVERGPDPYKKSADQLLEEASHTETKTEEPTYDDTPSVKDWLTNVFGIFTDPGVVAHWIGLSVLGSLPAIIALSLENDALTFALFPGGYLLGVLTVICGVAILHRAANRQDRVHQWPTLEPIGWIKPMIYGVIAATVAAVPLWVVCTMILGPDLISAAITMFSVFVFFPFMYLSMLDMNVPFSAEVARSVSKNEEAWGGFYFSSGLLFVALFMVFAMSAGMAPAANAVVAIVAGVATTFIYFSMLGRLAYAIGQTVDGPPPKSEQPEAE